MENKNSLIGFILIGLVFVGFVAYSNWEQQRYQETLQAQATENPEQTVQTQEETPSAEVAQCETAEQSEQTAQLEQEVSFIRDAQEEKTLTVENDLIAVTLSSKGAQITDITLKDYTKFAPKNERNELVHLFDGDYSSFNLSLFLKNEGKNVPLLTAEHNFSVESVSEQEDATKVCFRLNVGDEGCVDFIYTIYRNSTPERAYMIDFSTVISGVKPLMANQASVNVDWMQRTFQNERSYKSENMYTDLSYHNSGEIGIDNLGVTTSSKQKDLTAPVDWISFKQQFFSTVLIGRSCKLSGAQVEYTTCPDKSGWLKDYSVHANIEYTAAIESYDFSLYCGPNRFSILKKLTDQDGNSLSIERMIPLGWIVSPYISRWIVIPVFDFLREYISSFGLIILILTLLVKIIISPLTYKSYLSTAKMRVIRPEIEALSAKYPRQEDSMKKQQATMELYKKAGINPMGGCIPMLIQMPILIAMFRFFPASIELRGQSFLWSDDLSSYDSVLQLPFEIPFYGDHVSLFALLMAVAMFAFSYLNYNQTAGAQPQMAGMKFMTVYMMPVMMLLWFNDYSSGLCYYYFLSQIFTVIQTLFIRRMIDDEKIHAALQANLAKKSNGKKSKFQLKYEEMLKQQEKLRK